MRRGLWFAAGAGAGLYAAIRGQRALETFTPDGLRMRWQALGVGARLLRDEVAAGKAEAEPVLRERLRPARTDTTPQLTTGGPDTPSLVPREDHSTNDIQEGKQ
jgi:hypothetical protein